MDAKRVWARVDTWLRVDPGVRLSGVVIGLVIVFVLVGSAVFSGGNGVATTELDPDLVLCADEQQYRGLTWDKAIEWCEGTKSITGGY